VFNFTFAALQNPNNRKMIKKALAIIFTLLTNYQLFAQAVFQKTFTQGNSSTLSQIIKTNDGGLAAIGTYENGNDDIWLVKTDAAGNVQFTTTLTGAGAENAFGLVQSSGGDYFICGSIETGNNAAILLSAINASGNTIWQKTFEGGKTDIAQSITLANNGDILIAGYSTSIGIAYPKGFIIRTDATGNMKWAKAYTQINTQSFNKVIEANDGSILVAGYQVAFGNTDKDWVVLNTDSTGTLNWGYTYGDLSDEEAFDIIQVGGFYYVAGYSASAGAGSRDMFVMQLGLSGNILAGRVIGTDKSETAYNIHYYDNTSLAITGTSEITSVAGNKEVGTIIRTDFLLNPYQATYLGDSNAVFNPVSSIVTASGKIALAGKFKSPGSSNYIGLMMQNNLAYSAACNELYPTIIASAYIPNHLAQSTEMGAPFLMQTATLISGNPTISNNTLCFTTGMPDDIENPNYYPNPATHLLQFSHRWEGSIIELYNTNGTKCYQSLINNNNISITGLPAGLYMALVSKNTQVYRFKFIKQ
jgi:hypothetical protein